MASIERETMRMTYFDLKYGKSTLGLDVPEQRLVHVIEGAPYEALDNIETAVVEALNNPVGTAPLNVIVNAGETVCIVVSDITRAWLRYDLFLPAVVNYLNEAGIPDENIFLLIAYGAHRLQTEAECRMEFGDEIVNRLRIEHSSGINPDSKFVHLGNTSHGGPIEINELAVNADRVILTGAIMYHSMAGFGGGRKAVLPGISSYAAIQRNHCLCLGPNQGDGISEAAVSGNISATNLMHQDQVEHASALDADFLINVVLNAEDKIARLVCGHWDDAWHEGTELVNQIYGVSIDELADCVVVTPGGYPKDINLYQALKAQENAIKACKPGGVVIMLMELEDINEPADFMKWFNIKDLYDREKTLREGFTVPGFVALLFGEALEQYHHILVTLEDNKAYEDTLGLPIVTTVEEAIELATKYLGKEDFTITVMPQGSNTMPILK